MREKPLLVRAIQIQSDGTAVEKTVRADSLRPNPLINAPLTDGMRERLKAVYRVIGRYVTHDSMGTWVEGFTCNEHPLREIEIWERIVRAYELRGGSQRLGERRRRETVRTLCAISVGVVDISGVLGHSDSFIERCRNAYLRANGQPWSGAA